MAEWYHINNPDAVIDEHADYYDDDDDDAAGADGAGADGAGAGAGAGPGPGAGAGADPAYDVCGCGCELQFCRFNLGLEIYVGQEWLMAERELLAYKWRDYLSPNHCTTWGELQEYITTNFNNSLNNMYVPENAPWYHLYNSSVRKFDMYPLNGVLNYAFE